MSLPPPIPSAERRYDIDWLRTIAIFLLIVYHLAISFQWWGYTIGFPTNREPLDKLWVPMSALNIWRIPLLFVVSGMGVYFALQRRSGPMLLKERSLRILLPFLFGFFFICPINVYFILRYFEQKPSYQPNAGHLWFLASLFLYTLLTLPLLLHLKKNPQGHLISITRNLLSKPWALPLLIIPFGIEAALIRPEYYSLFANTWHGFWVGLFAFLIGFLLSALGPSFRRSSESACHAFLALALSLFLYRTFQEAPERALLLSIEGWSWILAVLGYASKYLDQPSAALSYLSPKVYPVYILHMPVQFGLSLLLLPCELAPWLKFTLLVLLTLAVSLTLTLVIAQVRILRPLFGLKWTPKKLPSAQTRSNLSP